LFGSGIYTEFGILISSRKVLKKSAICLVLEFIQNSAFLFHHARQQKQRKSGAQMTRSNPAVAFLLGGVVLRWLIPLQRNIYIDA